MKLDRTGDLLSNYHAEEENQCSVHPVRENTVVQQAVLNSAGIPCPIWSLTCRRILEKEIERKENFLQTF